MGQLDTHNFSELKSEICLFSSLNLMGAYVSAYMYHTQGPISQGQWMGMLHAPTYIPTCGSVVLVSVPNSTRVWAK